LAVAAAEVGKTDQELVADQVAEVLQTPVQAVQELQVKVALEELAVNMILLAAAVVAAAQVLSVKVLVPLEELQKDPMVVEMVAQVH
jgi:hypothetical protein